MEQVDIADIDGDGKNDILAHATGASYNSRTRSGSLYMISNSLFSSHSSHGTIIDMANVGNYNYRYDVASATGQFADVAGVVNDLNQDDKPDIIMGAPFTDFNGKTNNGSLYIIYNFPHTLTLNPSSSIISGNISIAGAASSPNSVTNVSGVQYLLDSNDPGSSSWKSCTGTTSFTCTVDTSSLSDGSHTVYFRAYDENISYTAQSHYASASFTFDHTSPLVDFTDTSGNSKKYQSSGGDNVYTTDQLPTFTFSKSSDTTAGISKYQILVNNDLYIDSIDPNKPGDKDYREDDDKYIKYDGDTISVHAKQDKDKLVTGKAYKWKVRVVDNAGNTTDTSEKILRINTHEANFSGSFFPISLLSIGEKKTNITTLHYDQIPSILSINSTTPTFFGIAPVNTKVALKIEKTNDTKSGRDLVLSTTSTANESSRFGINVTNKLDNKQDYFINLSAINPQGDYVEIPEFKLAVGSKSYGTNKSSITNKSVKQEIPESKIKIPTPKPQTQKPIQKQKRCFLLWCW